MDRLIFLFVALFTLISLSNASRKPLNSFIRHHERLNYDAADVHRRTRRAIELSPYANVHIKFNAFGKKFGLHLSRNHDIFAKDFKIIDNLGNHIPYDYSRFYQGGVEGAHRSHCLGKIDEGRFEGTVHLGNEEYHIEPAEKYFNNDTARDFHSIIYRISDVEHNARYGKAQIPDRPTTLKGSSLAKQMQSEAEKLKDGKHRYRRGTKNRHRNTCNLKLVADHLFMRKFVRRETAIDQMVLHYKAVEYIFRNQTFNVTGKLDTDFNPEGIGFRIKEVHVWLKENTPEPLKPEYISIYRLLELFSRMNHSSVCLSYLFTDRSFDEGVMGLAWVGYPYGQPGGICDPYANYNGVWKTYNTGLVTFRLFNREVPKAITEITFAHELGHSFGAKHDPNTKDCQPGTQGLATGNYIMYNGATPGSKKNNKAFSTCSISKMITVINAKGLDVEKGCFTDRFWAICGNGAHEEGEICDCGTVETCVEKCCVPLGAKGRTPCTLMNEAYECSPSRGPCCLNDTCTLAREFLKCFDGTQCRPSRVCDGLHYHCPAANYTANLTLCDKDRSVCINGYCQGSICLKYGYESCLCENTADKCKVCCQYEGKCKPSHLIPEMSNTTMSRGTPCNYYKGYCNALGVCENINMDGPMRLLYYTFFTEEGIKVWFARYWFVLLLGSFLILCMLAAFVYYCQHFTPTDNPFLQERSPHKPLRKHRKRVQGGYSGGPYGGGQSIPMKQY